jgi:hypothetical protein
MDIQTSHCPIRGYIKITTANGFFISRSVPITPDKVQAAIDWVKKNKKNDIH